jgi:hypothetical protein
MAEDRNKKKQGAPPRTREGVNLNVWLSAELMQAFESFREKTRRTKTAEIEVMMEEYLAKNGHWPLAEGQE